MSIGTWGWLVLGFPLAGAIVCSLLYRSPSKKLVGYIGSSAIFLSFLSGLGALIKLQDLPEDHRSAVSNGFAYAHSAGIDVDLGILIDPLSVFMVLVVSGVSFLIHVYSTAYMESDVGYARFFAYLNFFVFSMLLLVLANNFILLIVGWAFVGAASYLLISFWYRRQTATAAGIKAFVMNVIGDVGLVIGAFLLFQHTGALDYDGVFSKASGAASINQGWLVAACLMIIVGAFAKSAQVPLQTWLPDAMEGPTPVSALIHAATMVTAGVYLIARTHPLFEQARTVELLAAGTGALTLLVAGLIALVQTDIKRVIAYSTMSQIGYMFLGAGIGAYANGMFHLMTHAFFKALLFLAAGLVIHALAGEQDIRNMRGIGAAMPWTRWAFLAGSLALVGVPPFAGFFSKDSIIAAALHDHWYGVVLAVAALAGAFLTGVYPFRLYFIVFGSRGETRPVHEGHAEGPWTMLVPVGILSVLAVVGGWLQFAPFWIPETHWLEHVAGTLPVAEATNTNEGIASVAAVLLGVAGIAVAWLMYGRERVAVPRRPFLQRALEHKLYFDELYDALFYKPAAALATYSRRDFEEPVVLAA